MKKLFGLGIISLILLTGFVIAGVSFPASWTMNLNSLPAQQSIDQKFYSCPYDTTIQHRITRVSNLEWNGTIPTVTAEVEYWTRGKKCAGSRQVVLTLPSTTTSAALAANFVIAVNAEFLTEANSNRRPNNRTVISVGT